MEALNTLKESERRQATVMFADISGYTSMSEKMDPEDVVSIMNDCFRMMGLIVKRNEGTIDKFIGDCIMVLFGVPAAIEEAPQKAVNTAIEIRNGLSRLNKENNLKIPLDIHIGINTGVLIAGTVGFAEKKEYTVMGDTVNLASRLKDVSEKGQIYVGPLTYRYTKNNFDYKELAPIWLKGKEEPVSVFELLSVREQVYRARLGSERMISSEMVGRHEELALLERHAMQAINGEGSIVNIVGEAGIGKSRLITELRSRETIQGVPFFEGRALSTGKNLSFHPIIDLLKKWTRIREGDSEIIAEHKLERAIRSISPDEVTEVFPFIAILMGMELQGEYAERVKGIEGEALEKLILKTLRELLMKATELTPIFLVIEDLHWADMTSIEFFESLYQLAKNHRILFINALRPNYEDTSERILHAVREKYGDFHSTMYLEPLNENQCEVLINNLLKIKGLPTHIRDLITRRAEGNPFFIEEVVRSFIDDGVVEMREDRFEVTEKIDSVVIPHTIQEVLMSRIDKLDEQTRALLKVASVIGRNFLYKILAAVAESTDEIHERLGYLKEIQLIREKRDRKTELAYLFKHALAQEATYESILLTKRKELHLRIANSIEAVFAERLHEFYGMLTLHYSRGENLEKAEEYLIKAGEEALKTSASIEALHYYQEALKLYLKLHGESGDPEIMANLEKNIAIAFLNKGHYVEAISYFDKVLEYWGVRRPKNKIHTLLSFLPEFLDVISTLYFPLKRSQKIPDKRDHEIINLTEKRALALVHVDTRRLFLATIGTLKRLNAFDITQVENGVLVYIEGSGLFSFSGVSFKISRKILEYTKPFINTRDIKSVFIYNFVEFIHDFITGNWNKELGYKKDLVNRYLKTGEVYQAVAYTVLSAFLQIELGCFSEAKVLLNTVYDIGEIYDNDYARGMKYFGNAKFFVKRRELDDALNEANAGLSFFKKVRHNLPALSLAGIKANIQFLLKDVVGTKHSLLQAKEFDFHEKDVAPFYISNVLISQFLLDLYLLEESNRVHNTSQRYQLRKKASRSGKVAMKNSMKYAANKTEAFKLMGVYHWSIGKQERALGWLAKSINVGERLGALPELARTYMEVGKRLLERKGKSRELHGIHAEEFLEKAEALFQDMDLAWDAKELKKIKSMMNQE